MSKAIDNYTIIMFLKVGSLKNITDLYELDLFVLKLNSNGSLIWANSFGSQSVESGFSIYSDDNGDVILTGQFSGTVDFDSDTSVYNISSLGNTDFFVLKLNSNGNFVWVYTAGDSGYLEGRQITLDSKGNILVVGYSTAGTDFDPDTGITYLHPSQNQNSRDVFVLKLNSMGDLIWVRGIKGLSSSDRANSVLVDLNDNIYTTGYFGSTADFDPNPSAAFNLTSSGLEDIFIQKLDPNGNFLWAKSMGSSGDDQGLALAIDDFNNIYTTGSFKGTVDFDPDTVDSFNLISNGGEDIFIQKLDSNGNFIWVESFGGNGSDQTLSMIVDESGSIFTAGYFEGIIDFDPDTNSSFNLSSNGGNDHFILKLNQCSHSYDTLLVSSFRTYTSPSGKIWTKSGIYSDTIANSTGCDSLLTINLSITIIDTTLTLVNHVKITANDTLSSYQWIECTTGPIAGDTNRSFIATANGNYAVVLSNNGCIDTSVCVNILSVGLNDFSPEEASISFYPNPNNGVFTVEVGQDIVSKTFQIYDMKGSLIQEDKFTSNRTSVDLRAYGKGIYFLAVKSMGIREKVVVY